MTSYHNILNFQYLVRDMRTYKVDVIESQIVV